MMNVRVAVAAGLILVAGASAAGAQDRREMFSTEFQTCVAGDSSGATLDECQREELDRQQARLEVALRGALRRQQEYSAREPADLVQSQRRWEEMSEQECRIELNLGGRRPDMRQTACLIVLTIQRIEYLNGRGIW